MHRLSTFPTRAAFAHFVEARPPHALSRLRLSSLRATARDFATRRLPAAGLLVPLLLNASRHHAGDRATLLLSDYEGWAPFIPRGTRRFHGAHKVVLESRAVRLATGHVGIPVCERATRVVLRLVSGAGLGQEPVARGRIEVNGRLVCCGDQLPSFRSHAILVRCRLTCRGRVKSLPGGSIRSRWIV